jgi:hypothetical protein
MDLKKNGIGDKGGGMWEESIEWNEEGWIEEEGEENWRKNRREDGKRKEDEYNI